MPTDDDLVALANAVREAAVHERPETDSAASAVRGLDDPPPEPSPRQGIRPAGPAVGARRHLRVVSGDDDANR